MTKKNLTGLYIQKYCELEFSYFVLYALYFNEIFIKWNWKTINELPNSKNVK